MVLENGSSVGPYKIIERVGEGGMGVVYKSRDTRLGRLVALKTLPPGKMADTGRRSRFIQEAQAASTLNHPNIVVVYDIGADNGVDFIAMEYVSGRNLGEMIPRGGMRLSDALKFAVQIADGLAKAHSVGIVHRDIKPSNIRVSDDGTVKILDFGLAKLTQPEPAGPDQETATARAATADGIIVGTAAYMSPEQVESGRLDGRSDIFSFGAVLYEMLSGRRAFTGESQMSLLTAILHKEPAPLAELAPGLPQELYRLVARCLRKDPERRFQHIGDVKVALQELKDESDSGLIPDPMKSATRSSRAVPALLGFLALGVVTAGIWLSVGRNTAPPIEPIYQPVPFVSHPGDERDPTFSPDGTQIAYSWSGETDEGLNIYVKLIGPGAPIRLTKTPGDIEPQWSPDGRWIAFMRHTGGKTFIVVIPALGGPERILREPRANILSWSSDSQWIFADTNDGSIERIAIGTGERLPVLGKIDGKSVSGPALSPDSRRLAFSVFEGADRVLHSIDLDVNFKPSGPPRRLIHGIWSVVSPTFTADGKDILFVNGNRNTSSHMWRVAADGSGPPRRLTWAGDYAWFLGVSQRGNRMAFTRLNSDIDIKRIPIDPDGSFRKEPEPWLPSTLIETSPAFSPDGAKVAFQSFRSGAAAVWIANADGSQPFPLTHFEGMHTGSPSWSPDGKRIAFHSRGDGKQQADIYLINADGSGLKRLTDDPAVDNNPSWSRDGASIYFSSFRTGRPELMKMPVSGGAAVQITRSGANHGVESFDGKWVYLPARVNGPIRRIPATGGPEEELVATKGAMGGGSFAPSSRGLYYLGSRPSQLYLLADGGTPKALGAPKRPAGGVFNAFSISPDGKTLLYCHVASFGSDIHLVENFR